MYRHPGIYRQSIGEYMDISGNLTRRRVLALGAAVATQMAGCGRTIDNGDNANAELNLTSLSASEAIAAMHNGRLSAVDYAAALLKQHYAMIDLNAFISIEPERVMADARAADQRRAAGARLGPLHGLPIPIKDSVNTKDYPTTSGTPALMDFTPKEDAALVKLLLDAGAIIMGKTNLHELSFGWTSNNFNTGAVRNPYDMARIPGGSSGGTAAAIAGRVAPLGIAEDTEGSIRVPAALCGLYGFRPTLHRYPNDGVTPLQPLFDQVGPLARTMDDIVLFDQVVAGDEQPIAIAELRGVRIGVDRGYYFSGLDNEVDRICSDALRELERAGVVLVEAAVPDLEELIGLTTYQCQSISIIADLNAYLAKYGAGINADELLEQASPNIREAFAHYVFAGGGLAFSEQEFEAARNVHLPRLRQVMSAYFAENDIAAMLFPATMTTAAEIGDEITMPVNGKAVPIETAMGRNIAPGSTAGIPGLVIPAGLSSGGLPVSLELDGPAGSDRLLLSLGRAFESVLGKILPPVV